MLSNEVVVAFGEYLVTWVCIYIYVKHFGMANIKFSYYDISIFFSLNLGFWQQKFFFFFLQKLAL